MHSRKELHLPPVHLFLSLLVHTTVTKQIQRGLLYRIQRDVSITSYSRVPAKVSRRSAKWKPFSCLHWLTRLCCGELLHSDLVATADLLRRVHAHWPPAGHASPSCLTLSTDNMQVNKPNACTQLPPTNTGVLRVVEKKRRHWIIWILTSGLSCQPLFQRRAGCGYEKSFWFGGGGDDNERNPIASEASIGGGGSGVVGDWK